MSTLYRFASIAWLGLIACGDGGDDSDESLCAALCSHAQRCGQSGSSFCGSGCGGLRERNYTAAASDALENCLTRSCSASRDLCTSEAASSLPVRDPDVQFRAECADSSCGFDARTCSDANRTELLRIELVEELISCLGKWDCSSSNGVIATRDCVFDLLPPGS